MCFYVFTSDFKNSATTSKCKIHNCKLSKLQLQDNTVQFQCIDNKCKFTLTQNRTHAMMNKINLQTESVQLLQRTRDTINKDILQSRWKAMIIKCEL